MLNDVTLHHRYCVYHNIQNSSVYCGVHLVTVSCVVFYAAVNRCQTDVAETKEHSQV